MPSRRSFVSSVGSALAAATAGCLAAGRSPVYEPGELSALNRTTERHTLAVSVTAAGTTYFEDTFDLAPDDTDGSDVLLADPLPDEPRPYVVEARLDGGDPQPLMEPTWSTATCREIVAIVEPPGQRTDTVLSVFASSCD